MQNWKFTKGLHDLGNGTFAYILPDGSWGWSNAGLVTDGGKALLVDTLMDLALTREMLRDMKQATPAARSIDVLVNTHGNADHWYGNQLVEGAEIISSEGAAEGMKELLPQGFAELMKNAPALGEAGGYIGRIFSPFKFDDITPVLPTRTFVKRLDLKVGRKEVQLIEVGPAHTHGDVRVHVPDDKTIFAGDILFIGGTPIMWGGPMANWIRACDLMLSMKADKIVPGHGPITDNKGVEAVKGYLEYVYAEARRRYDAGMTVAEAATDIDLGTYASWGESERIVVNVNTLYQEFSGVPSSAEVATLFELMAKYPKKKE